MENNGLAWYGKSVCYVGMHTEPSVVAIRPSTQGSWECPKATLAVAQGKLNDKE